MPDCSDDNTLCELNITSGSDYGTITTKDDNEKYVGKCAPLITNVAEFFNAAPLTIPTRKTAGKLIVRAKNM